MQDTIIIRRALLSVSDKAGLVELARALHERGVELVSTGGTAKALAGAGLPVTPVERLTGFPEMLDGRVKTLHPAVHGGLLARRDSTEHLAAAARHGLPLIDMVCVNLYPFEQTIARPSCSENEAIEHIDIGGPSMIRSASKNHDAVVVLTSPGQYARFLEEFRTRCGGTGPALRAALAAEAFALTARYDGAIAAYLSSRSMSVEPPATRAWEGSSMPEVLSLRLRLAASLRYGENPHQRAALYREDGDASVSVASCSQLHGKELSYNNLHDAAAALDLARALAERSGACGACVIKHANPCGACVGESADCAIAGALAGDPVAAYGGILACSGMIDDPAAARLAARDVFLEVIVAAGFTPLALAALRARSASVRLLAFGAGSAARSADRDASPHASGLSGLRLRSITGGVLVQTNDDALRAPEDWEHRAGPRASGEQLAAAAMVEVMVRAMNSNAVAIGGTDRDSAEGGAASVSLFGAGLGQLDRVTACRLATEKAGPRAIGAAAVSDAFFPFADGPALLVNAGVKVLVHPGGSKRDDDTFALCVTHGVSCYVTGIRHFRH
ncbi:MAG: bifunctional phosphoribosylaminoimidazolecarboxamide formyltransferase/IMP cyclohydrolase [Phycisphaerae bacterium]|nr:bifunctional phosphoribosylaminoimidazolecarboxamide formyltransferase/IMP cyclohydrolase [Phycisphaerae bacterium]